MAQTTHHRAEPPQHPARANHINSSHTTPGNVTLRTLELAAPCSPHSSSKAGVDVSAADCSLQARRGVCPSSGSQQGCGTGSAALPRCAWALQPSTGTRENIRKMRGSEEGSEEVLPQVILSPAEQLPQLLTSRFQPGKRQHPASQKPQTSFLPLILPVLPG